MVSAKPRISVTGILKFLATLPMASAISSGTASKAVAIWVTVRVKSASASRGTSIRAAAVYMSAIWLVGTGSSRARALTSATIWR